MKSIKKLIYKFIYYVYKLIRPKSFTFQNKKINYENSFYNTSFINERSIEVPIVKELILEETLSKNICSNENTKKFEILEIGNVLSYYNINLKRDIVDKYEQAENVINEDIEFFNPGKKYDLIISISTLEHVGNDAPEEIDSAKLGRVLKHITENLISETGTIIITLPINQNKNTDSYIFSNSLSGKIFHNFKVFERNSFLFNLWKEIPYKKIEGIYRNKPVFIKHVYIAKLTNTVK